VRSRPDSDVDREVCPGTDVDEQQVDSSAVWNDTSRERKEFVPAPGVAGKQQGRLRNLGRKVLRTSGRVIQ